MSEGKLLLASFAAAAIATGVYTFKVAPDRQIRFGQLLASPALIERVDRATPERELLLGLDESGDGSIDRIVKATWHSGVFLTDALRLQEYHAEDPEFTAYLGTLTKH